MKMLRHSLVLLLFVFIVAACSKKEDAINPDAGAEVAGTYNVTKIRASDGTMLTVQPGYGKTIQLVRQNETQVMLSITLAEPGKTLEVLNSKDPVDLKRSGSTISLNAPDGTPIGEYKSGTLELKITQNGQSGTFIGTR